MCFRYARASVVFGFAILEVDLSEKSRCDFTGGKCDKGKIYDDGSVGCGFYDQQFNQCSWFDYLPPGMPPRMFYNERKIELMKEIEICP